MYPHNFRNTLESKTIMIKRWVEILFSFFALEKEIDLFFSKNQKQMSLNRKYCQIGRKLTDNHKRIILYNNFFCER